MQSDKKVVITGATSGIGEATLRVLTDAGYSCLAIGRNVGKLEILAQETGSEFLAVDVRDLATIVPAIVGFEPDILVNNAGVGHGIDGLLGSEPATIQEAIDINVTSMIQITTETIPGMIERRSGHVVNVGSIAGLHTAISALYGATKSAVHMFSQNLRSETVGTGLRVTEVCPGRTRSGFYNAAKGDPERLNAMTKSGIRELLPEDIAAAILYAVSAPPHVNVSTIELLPTDQAIGGVQLKPSHS